MGCIDKAQNTLGWLPKVTFKEMVNMMVVEDLHLQKEKIKDMDDLDE